MSDEEFGTVNLRREDRVREIEVLRHHRQSLVKMLADVDQQLRELELIAPVSSSAATHPALRGHQPDDDRPDDDGPATRPLLNSTAADYDESGVTSGGGASRVLLILGAAVLALTLIGWLIWRASSDRPAATTTVGEESSTTEVTEADPVVEETATVPPAVAASLVVAPKSHDYGLVRKGTRATRQFEVANDSDEPMSIAVARSACRCLYYEHAPVIPPKARESITVTVDGARAKSGTLRETVKVSSKSDPAVSTSFEVIATVR